MGKRCHGHVPTFSRIPTEWSHPFEAHLQGALVGPNDFKKTGYGGPCPPIGRHRYFHKLYALDITLDLKGAMKSQIEQAMQGHILANAELIGTYQKGDR